MSPEEFAASLGDVADLSDPTVQLQMTRLMALKNRIAPLQAVTMLGAVICSFWLIYRVYTVSRFLAAFVAFLLLSFAFKLGVSPMFAAAASYLCFKLGVVGIWLPILSYILGATLLYVDLKIDRFRQRIDPLKLFT